MLDHGISLRCVLTWAAFVAAVVVGAVGALLGSESLSRAGMMLAATGFMLVILNDNARTRRLLWRLAEERKNAEHGVRTMH